MEKNKNKKKKRKKKRIKNISMKLQVEQKLFKTQLTIWIFFIIFSLSPVLSLMGENKWSCGLNNNILFIKKTPSPHT